MSIKRIPKHLQNEGRKFWKSVLSEYELDKTHDFELLGLACQCLDRMQNCRDAIDQDGLFQKDRYGRSVEHDGLKVERAQKKLFLSIIREMGLSLDREQPQRGRLYQ